MSSDVYNLAREVYNLANIYWIDAISRFLKHRIWPENLSQIRSSSGLVLAWCNTSSKEMAHQNEILYLTKWDIESGKVENVAGEV